MSFWLARFVCETCNASGRKYPASTIHSLLSGLLRQARAINPDCQNFLDPKDARFREMHNIINHYFRELLADGVGAEVEHTSLISIEEENELWEKGILRTDTPQALLNAVFYLNDKHFCLRGGKEHRRLKISQVVQHDNPIHYIYTEDGSKNRSGGLFKTRSFLFFHVPRLGLGAMSMC